MRELVIVGAGGHAREIAALVEAANAEQPAFALLGFLVEAAYGTAGSVVDGWPILGDLDWLEGHAGISLVCGVGAPALRRRLARRAADFGARFESLVHPRAVIDPRASVGEGSVIQAGCVVTSGARLGFHVHLNVGATVSHDCTLDDYVTLAPGVHAAGGAAFGEGCDVGVGASILPRRRVGAWSVVGGGAVVARDVPRDTVAVGVPARPLRALAPGWHLAG